MVGQSKYKEALQIIMEDLPLPGVLGRICPHGCEDACRRCDVDHPVAIRNLKRLAADKFDPRNVEIKMLPKREDKVAIIGSGPAGLSAAYQLARNGVLSTIFEALPKAGGMLRVGIPEHRLPRDVLDNEIEVITNLGVEIKTNTPLGSDLTIDDLFAKGYKSVYIAIGAHKGFDLGVPGEKAKGVRQGVDFLREVNLTGKAQVGKNVAIIGGGNVAIDVARCAVRLGAEKVNIIYRRTRSEMPAWEEEIHAAETEGTEITYLAAPQEILTADGNVIGLRCIRMELGEPDSSGRRRPVPVPGSEYDIEIDQLIPAIGQKPDLSALENVTGLDFSKWGTVETDSVTYATGRAGVFAGGDVQTGPWVAIGAIAAGKEAADSIMRYLDGKDMAEGREAVTNENPVYRPVPKGEPIKSRAVMPELSAEKRAGNFKEVELGYNEEDGAAEAGRCLNCGYCCECNQCVDACLAGAVDHSQKVEEKQIDVGSVILCPGADTYDPSSLDEFYHYKTNPNVLTSLEFERLLSASGPTMGHLLKPSDKKEPQKIAWLQCIGSRDNNKCGNGYCSSVCCMYAIKDAMVSKEHANGDLDCAIFNIDIRTFGKDYEKYYDRAKDEQGVRFINARIHTIDEVGEEKALKLRYADDSGQIQEEIFDMVVLSVGLQVSESTVELAKKLDVDINKNNFAVTKPFEPVMTSRPGVYACGIFQGPKDIPHSVMEASAAACGAGISLTSSRGTLVKDKIFPEEIALADQQPRVGVFVCNCGINIGGVADVPAIVEYAKSLPGVAHVEDNLFSCSNDTQDKIVEVIKKNNLNRIVVAACTPKTHEPLFQETIRNAGLNPYLFEMANIRNQCTWVHSNEKEKATQKAKDLLKMAVSKAALLESIPDILVDVEKSGLVIGGGVAGMTAALCLADQGFSTTLVEKSNVLGGSAQNLTKTWDGQDVRTFLSEKIQKVENHPNINLLLDAEVKDASGFVGNFETNVVANNTQHTIKHGITIIATGGKAAVTDEYLYGEHPSVTTWHDLEHQPEKLKDANSIVFIQCVGSRDENRPYCSMICCTSAISQAVSIKEEDPDKDVFVLYRDIRTYGEKEELYKKAREKGIIFIRYKLDKKPLVKAAGKGLEVTVFDPVLQRSVQIQADLVNLSTAIEPMENDALASVYKLPLNAEKFFMEAHAKLRPVDFATEGLFICGLAHYPKPLDESISQAYAAAGRAVTILSRNTITISPLVSQVDAEKCIGCGLCAEICPFGGIVMEDPEGKGQKAKNIPASCKGCGLCSASCPQKAIDMLHFRDKQIMAAVNAAV